MFRVQNLGFKFRNQGLGFKFRVQGAAPARYVPHQPTDGVIGEDPAAREGSGSGCTARRPQMTSGV